MLTLIETQRKLRKLFQEGVSLQGKREEEEEEEKAKDETHMSADSGVILRASFKC